MNEWRLTKAVNKGGWMSRTYTLFRDGDAEYKGVFFSYPQADPRWERAAMEQEIRKLYPDLGGSITD